MSNLKILTAYLEQIIPQDVRPGDGGVEPVITLTSATPRPRGGFTTKAITLHPADVVDVIDAVHERREARLSQLEELQRLSEQRGDIT